MQTKRVGATKRDMKAIFCEKRMGKNQLEKGEAIAHAPELF